MSQFKELITIELINSLGITSFIFVIEMKSRKTQM
jgi:hypothetical protein